MRVKIHISLKDGVLDPQGKTIADTLSRMGYDGITSARMGKTIEMDIESVENETALRRQIDAMCKSVLVNSVIEQYNVELVK